MSSSRPDPPPGLVPVRRTPTFTAETVPPALLANHQTTVWARLEVEAGAVTFAEADPPWETTATPGEPVSVVPRRAHRVTPSPDARFAVQFYDEPTEGRTVQYRKWDGSLHWRHDLVALGRDEHGIWLGGAAKTIVQRGLEPPTAVRTGFVQLIAPDVPWTAIFNQPGGKYEVYIDLTTHPSWVTDDRVELIDLDLDVVRRPGGEVALLDEDEFAEHAERFAYPTEVVAETTQAAHRLLAEVEARVEPFGTAAHHWLAQLDPPPR